MKRIKKFVSLVVAVVLITSLTTTAEATQKTKKRWMVYPSGEGIALHSLNKKMVYNGQNVIAQEIGFGTITFVLENKQNFSAIAHAVTTEEVKGGIYSAVSGKSLVTSNAPTAISKATNELGLMGTLLTPKNYSETSLIPIAFPQEIKTGEAIIRTSFYGSSQDVPIEIINTNLNGKLHFKVVDKTFGELRSGMSGSPILQNGMIIGAVSHRFSPNTKQGTFQGLAEPAINMVNRWQ